MYKKTIKYPDYFGETREEDFYFNLTKAELIKMRADKDGDLEEVMKKIIQTKDANKLIQYFDKIILSAYGERSADGRYFLKEDENGHLLANKFKQTPAYDILFMELLNNEGAMIEFIKHIMPEGLSDQVLEDRGLEIKALVNNGETAQATAAIGNA